MKKILIIDDDKVLRESLALYLEDSSYLVLEASNGFDGLNILRDNDISAILLDLKMPEMDGFQVIEAIKKLNLTVPVILLTAYGDINTAVKAVKLGAYDFITKPPDFGYLTLLLDRAVNDMELKNEVHRLNQLVDNSLESVLGSGKAMKNIINDIKQVAPTNFTILIQGETGTGKSYLAALIHKLSKLTDKQFIKIDIGSLSENIIESELFGHEKGAFTGADKKKKGFFEIASGGTIFIDEIENLPYALQGKLLSSIGDKYFYYVGGNKAVSMDVRLITASNQDLYLLNKEDKFRKDLYYRLTEFVVTVPPLRERVEDIPFFVNKFLVDACDELNKPLATITDTTMDFLTQQPWKGNIRELKNCLRRVVLMSNKTTITPEI
ncbi:MAG: sigma-54 dependent transcriptional regulator, partial [Candidatus Magnetoovum sp. WYHC-5]|nr:sigma-54 dependent transcriptional regulator [Candidatus Magnetoovum sp. WYHC-5]